MDIKTIEGKVSFDEAVDWIEGYALKIRKHKEEIIENNYLEETNFNLLTAMRIDSIESMCILIREYLNLNEMMDNKGRN